MVTHGAWVLPVVIEEPCFGDQDAGLQILTARFEQEHLRILVFSQASRHDRAGGAGTNDDVVIAGPQGGAPSRLVGGDGHELVSGIADSRGGEAQVCGTLDESRAVDFPGEQLAFQQRKLHAIRSGRGIIHGRSPSRLLKKSIHESAGV